MKRKYIIFGNGLRPTDGDQFGRLTGDWRIRAVDLQVRTPRPYNPIYVQSQRNVS